MIDIGSDESSPLFNTFNGKKKKTSKNNVNGSNPPGQGIRSPYVTYLKVETNLPPLPLYISYLMINFQKRPSFVRHQIDN